MLQFLIAVLSACIYMLLAGDAARAVAFVVPHVRDAFTAGQGGWMKSMLQLIVHALKGNCSLGTEGSATLQWWIFVKANFPAISKDVGAFLAVAQQWDVRGVVYQSIFGKKKEVISTAGGKLSVANVAAAAVADVQPSASVGIAANTYFQNPLRHSFPSVSYHQRTTYHFPWSSSRVIAFRFASNYLNICIL